MILALLLYLTTCTGQSLLYNETFESGLNGWNVCYPANHNNNWSIGTLAGNGSSTAGINSAFVTIDGSSHNYMNSNSSDEKIIMWKQFSTWGYSNGFTFSFDWRGYGEYGIDDISVVICYSNPAFLTNWFAISSSICLTPAWTNETFIIPSPSIFNNNPSLKLGIMFRCNTINIAPPAFAFDNFMLIANQSPLGIDTTYNQTVINLKPQQYKYYNYSGAELIHPNGNCIRVDERGNAVKIYVNNY